ncbi:hypothetical protein TrST_g3393 [Triparma strigata]|uniref:Uncharacterized protein n=1 Tax=Triparma strigata TaxID=1606541 RepID=A0A9W7EY87_9STRA|nr:hypothetical protein TrST_g3393 [Triparma strigata]
MKFPAPFLLLLLAVPDSVSPLPSFLGSCISRRRQICTKLRHQEGSVDVRLLADVLRGGALHTYDNAEEEDEDSSDGTDGSEGSDGSGDEVDEDASKIFEEEEEEESEGSGDDDDDDDVDDGDEVDGVGDGDSDSNDGDESVGSDGSDEDSEEETEAVESEEEEEEEQTIISDVKKKAASSAASTGEAAAVSPPAPQPPAGMMKQMLVTFAAMAIIKKLDLASPVVIKNARIAFVAYHVSIQVLVAYVQWKCGNELKTQKPWKGETVVVESPWKKMLSAAVSSQGADAKNLMSTALSTKESLPQPEYDIQEAKKLRGSQFFPIAFMYYLHFKRGGVQPLIYQTIMGAYGLLSNPLVKVYVLGEKVERPFVVPGGNGMLGGMMPPPPPGVKVNEEVISVEEGEEGEEGEEVKGKEDEVEETEDESEEEETDKSDEDDE